MALYSRVTISVAPTSKTHASTHGFVEPITNTRPSLMPGVCLRASRYSFVSFAPYVPPSFPCFADCIILSTSLTVHTGIDIVRPK